jgi:AcrR family transcriptional regulator
MDAGMSENDAAGAGAAFEASWRERAVERSLRTARAKAVSRSDRFIQTATELLSETGRTDFTVQELVERSKTSLRSFYQHFGSKDELLLALFEEVIRFATVEWRKEIDEKDDCVAGLELLVLRLYAQSTDTTMGGMSRALTAYHLQLAQSRPEDYARVLAPMKDVIVELVEAGVATGRFRDDIEPEALAMILMQTLVAAAHMHALGAHLTGEPLDAERLWAFCMGGLTVRTTEAPKPARRGARASRR